MDTGFGGGLHVEPSMRCPSPSGRTTNDRLAGLAAEVAGLQAQVSSLQEALGVVGPAGDAAGVCAVAELLEGAIFQHYEEEVSTVLPGKLFHTLAHLLRKLDGKGTAEATAIAARVRRAASLLGLDATGIHALLRLRQVASSSVHARRDFSSAADVQAAIERAFGAGTSKTAALTAGVDAWFPAYARVRDGALPSACP